MDNNLFLVIIGILAILFSFSMVIAITISPVPKRRKKPINRWRFPESKLREYGWTYKPQYRLYRVVIKQRLSKKEILEYEAPDFITLHRFLVKVLDVDAKFSIELISNQVT